MILVIGAGSIGKRHLGNLIACGVREFTVVDPREDRRGEAAVRARAAWETLPEPERGDPPCLTLLTSSEAAARSSYDAVVIATPPSAHLEALGEAIARRIPVFCEKPLARDADDWGALRALACDAERAGIVTMVGYNYRFLPHLQRVRRLLAEGAVGTILSVRGTFSEHLREWHPWEGLNFYMSSRALGGGALLDESHLIDLCRWLFGEIIEVSGYNATLSSLGREPGFETDDLAELVVRFASGAVGSLHMDLYGRYHQKRLEVIGEDGTLFWHFDNTDLASCGIELWKGRRERVSADVTRRVPEQVIASDGTERNAMYLEEARYFLGAIKAGRHLRDDVPDLRDGLKTLAVARAARRAAGSRRIEPVETVTEPPAAAAEVSGRAGHG